MGEREAGAERDEDAPDRSVEVEPDIRHRANDLRLLLELVASRRAVAVVPALGQPERDVRVAVRPIAEGTFSRGIFVAIRASDRSRPSTAAVVTAIAAAQR